MIYQDRLYGKIKIKEPVILELIKSPSLQRLKKISQGAHAPINLKILSFPFLKPQVYRFEHSLGVFILLKKFGASLEEQIAGLIHDLSHSVFSHAIDYVLEEGSPENHSFQDKIFKEFVKKSEVAKIIKRFGFNLDNILNEKNFPLKEKPLPHLCADRIDYSLRDAVAYKIIPKNTAKEFIKNLKIINRKWVFKSRKYAEKFAKFYKKMNDIYYAGIASALMFRTVGDLLSYALSLGVISKNDLFTTDKEVMKKIKQAAKNNRKLDLLLKRSRGEIKFKLDKNNYNTYCICKSRVVDPLFEDGKNIKKISEVDKNWAKIIKEDLKPKEYFIRFLK